MATGSDAIPSKPQDEILEKGMKLLEFYEKGPWPSHVSEIKKTGYPIEAYARGLASGITGWRGGSAKIRYVFVGFISRRTGDGKSTEVHFRVFQPSGQFYTTEALRSILDFADKFGVGLIQATGQTGAMVISIKPDMADAAVGALRDLGTDLGDTGDTFRDFASCVGPALCEYALYDSLAARDYYLTYPPIQKHMSNQLFPFKVKLKFSACPLDCSRASSRADFGFIGTWEGAPDVEQDLFRRKAETGEVDPAELAKRCPGGAVSWDPQLKQLSIDGTKCKKSMNCVRRAFPAIKPPRKNRKIAFLVGGNAKGRLGPKMAKPVALLDDYKQGPDFIMKTVESWAERSPHKDRLGDFLAKQGYKKVLDSLKDSLPVSLQGEVAGTPRIVDSAVLSDEERRAYAEWSRKIADQYEGKEVA